MYFDELPKEGFEKCIICGKKTKGTAFCKDCWKEHDNDELLSILNESGGGIENKGITRNLRNFRKCWVCNSKNYCKFLTHSYLKQRK